MITVQWIFGESGDLTDAHFIREEVFIKEQNVPVEEEHDGTDELCIHAVLYANDEPVSTGRIMISPPIGKIDKGTGKPYTHDDFIIGRVATLKQHRGKGYAGWVMESLIKSCMIMGGERQFLHAQISAKAFYEKLDFKPIGEEFLDAGIPHIAMERFGGIGCSANKGEKSNETGQVS